VVEVKSAIRGALRALIERFPVLALAYRDFRESYRFVKAEPRPTPMGFLFAGNRAMERGEYEPLETRVFRALLEEVDVLVNVGANVGYYVCQARQYGRHVIAFEPVPANVRLLCKNLKANGWDDVEIYPVALAERPRIVDIFGAGTGASLVKGWAGTSERFVLRVPASSLDTVLGRKVDNNRVLVMIDVEGAEYLVLKGAEGLLSASPKPLWLIEITITEHLPSGQPVNPNLVHTFELMYDHGYHALALTTDLRPVSLVDMKRIAGSGVDTIGAHNFLFVEASQFARTQGLLRSVVTIDEYSASRSGIRGSQTPC
jgi:FkbM family methyltransferase